MNSGWVDEGNHADEETQVDEYDLTSTPNDFNVSTIVDFIKSGAVKMPGFQRNYVWDKKRASKLIESLIIGLPVPQVFLYEESRNKFLVIDGQQRLMSIYYFVNGRFPRKDKRVELRQVFDQTGHLPDSLLGDDNYFENFNLQLPEIAPGKPNKFHRKNYLTLDDYKTSLNLRTIRNVIVKQVKPTGDDSSIYEMFNRLNTGGVLLTPQEIRSSLYHSPFYDEMFKLNLEPRWRTLLNQPLPDLHMRDVEIMLRAIAVWKSGDTYTPSMVKFLNRFSKSTRVLDAAEVEELSVRFREFLRATEDLPSHAFLTKQQRFSLPLFEAVFAVTSEHLDKDPKWQLDGASVLELATSADFLAHSQEKTTDTANIRGRLKVARLVLRKIK